jgi:uncharacterized repeat protein (TIGR01451 family)
VRGALGGVPLLAAFLLLLFLTGGKGDAAPVAGTKITNQATATYENVSGKGYAATSNVVNVLVAAVASLTLGPEDAACTQASDGISSGSSFSRTFVLTNTSNQPDAYAIAAASTSAGRISALAFVASSAAPSPTTVGGTPSGVVSPGGSLSVSVTVDDRGVSPGTKMVISLSVRSTASASNGYASASAQQCGYIIAPPLFAGPLGPVVRKTVDGFSSVQVQPGTTVTYDIAFKNVGGMPATGVTLTDPLPNDVTPNVSSVEIGGVSSPHAATLSGSTLTIAIGNVAIAATVHVAFTAVVAQNAPTGSNLVNVASIAADGVAPVASSAAAILVGSADIVYDGDIGASAPISNAVLALVDTTGSSPQGMRGPQIAPNTNGENPFTTGSSGAYSFGLPAEAPSATYAFDVTAPGFAARKLQVVLVPIPRRMLYRVTLTALDGKPLAVAGGFSLTLGPVTLNDVYGVFGNIPMFHAQSVVVTKTVDRATATGGSRLVYTLTFANAATALGATTAEDDLPPGVAYAPGTARVDGLPREPTIVDGTRLQWSFPTLDVQHTIVFAAVVSANVSEGQTLTNELTVRAGIPHSPGFYATGSAQAQTVVVAGVFSDRIPITGRVFLDRGGSGRFVKGDAGVGGVRVWLEDGESVVTDSGGRFDFPAARPGMHVLHLDRETLPPGVSFFATHAYDSERSSVRLVHGPFDGGLLQDVNFALCQCDPRP